jgi:hypothetical protein
MMNSPTGRESSLWSVVLRAVRQARGLLWLFIGAPVPRPVPSRVKLLPRPTTRNPR